MADERPASSTPIAELEASGSAIACSSCGRAGLLSSVPWGWRWARRWWRWMVSLASACCARICFALEMTAGHRHKPWAIVSSGCPHKRQMG